MAKYIAQLIIAGTQVVGRAFARALKQEIEASQQAAQRLGNAKTRTERVANQKLGLSLDEAKQILNISKLSKEEIDEKWVGCITVSVSISSFKTALNALLNWNHVENAVYILILN